jgi:hypothetical protein
MREHVRKVNELVYSSRFLPFWGWHDDHRAVDRTAEYAPAMQQVKAEFDAMVDVIVEAGLVGGKCLQLGMGAGGASHQVWRTLFNDVMTIDYGIIAINDLNSTGASTHDAAALTLATQHAPFDFLFIDAGHDYVDVYDDHVAYGPLVRKGGIVAFHDALQREGFDEVEVWKYLLDVDVHYIGSEVGIAWRTA